MAQARNFWAGKPPKGQATGSRLVLSSERGDLFQELDQPVRRFQDCDPLRQLAFAEGIVEQPERALVSGVAAGVFAQRREPRDQFGSARLDLVVALAKALAR